MPAKLEYEEVMQRLRAAGGPGRSAESMARVGIRTAHAYGVSMPAIRRIAREAGKDHALAQQLWASGVHEARILAALVEVPSEVTEAQMEEWAAQFDSWDVCDQCCGSLFIKTPFAYRKAAEWSEREEEYVKRAAFATMAYLAVHDKQRGDEAFLAFLPIIEREADDDRNFVKKAVNWALRQVGKRNRTLNAAAIETATRIKARPSRSAGWIASDALRELSGESVQTALQRKE